MLFKDTHETCVPEILYIVVFVDYLDGVAEGVDNSVEVGVITAYFFSEAIIGDDIVQSLQHTYQNIQPKEEQIGLLGHGTLVGCDCQ